MTTFGDALREYFGPVPPAQGGLDGPDGLATRHIHPVGAVSNPNTAREDFAHGGPVRTIVVLGELAQGRTYPDTDPDMVVREEELEPPELKAAS